MRTILAFFGYVKVPKEVVLLSMLIEESYCRASKKVPDSESLATLYKSAKTITKFLRSGRLLT